MNMGATTYIKDTNGHVLGQLTELSHSISLIDGHGRFLGSYNKLTDVTTESKGNNLYKGNCLTMLIRSS